MKRKFFIMAPGTDQGKTLVTAALCYQLSALAIKPVICGGVEDTETLLKAMGFPVTEENIAMISPWRFRAALSPDEAARREGRAVVLEEIIAHCLSDAPVRASARREAKGGAKGGAMPPKITLIESAGGLMSPLSATATNLDLVAALGCPAIVVSASYLGCISQLLMTLEVLKMRGVSVAGVVLSQVEVYALAPEVILPSLMPHLPSGVPLICINHLAAAEEIWKTAPDLTALVSAQ